MSYGNVDLHKAMKSAGNEKDVDKYKIVISFKLLRRQLTF